MTIHRHHLPQLDGDVFLNDAGLETDLVFDHGIDIPAFAAHTLLAHEQGRASLTSYLEGFLGLARDTGSGFVLDTQTWRAQPHFAEELGQSTRSSVRRTARPSRSPPSCDASSRGTRVRSSSTD